MREQIAKIIATGRGVPTSYPEPFEGEHPVYQGMREPWLQRADQILALLREEIEKVENPYRAQKSLVPDVVVRLHAFEDCREKILALLPRPIEEGQ